MKACNSRFTQWKHYMHSIVWADRNTVQKFINMSFYQFLHDENPVLPIELSISTWSTLLWNSVRNRANLLALWMKQLKWRKENVEEATLYLRCEKKKNKKLFDEKHWTNSSFNISNLVLLHDTKLNNHYNMKFVPQWLEPYQIREAIIIKNTYFLEKLDEVPLDDTVFDNWIKHFYH